MSQPETKSRAEEILFPEGNTQIPSLGNKDVTLSIGQLRQLIDEKIIEGESASNAQPTLKEFLDFGESLLIFLDDDIQLKLTFAGGICFQLGQINLAIDSFELCNSEENINIECAIKVLPVVSKFAYDHRADEFTMSNTKFFAWWD